MPEPSSYIHIPFHQWTDQQLVGWCIALQGQDIPGWKAAVCRFLLEWTSEDDTITAHTSGSTGTPKPIKLEKSSMMASARATGKYLDLKAGDRALLCLPEQYIAGKMMLVRAHILKLDLIVVEPRSRPLQDLKMTIDFAAMVPNQVYQSMDQLHRIKKLIVGGGPISAQLDALLRNQPGSIFHTYGMTETITHVAMKRLNSIDPDPYFHALPEIHFTTDERGCLTIHAPRISTKPVVTHDLVELRDESTFKWLGRYDNVIISGGIKIIPEKLEQKIAHLFRQRFFIAAAPDEELGQKAILVLEGLDIAGQLESDLMREMRYLLPRHQVPKEIYRVGKFEETDSGKVKRAATLKQLKI